MSPSLRIPVAVVFLLAMSLSKSAAPAEHDPFQAQKTQSVRAVFPTLGSHVEAHVIEEAAARAVALSTLQIDSAASQPTVTFGFSEAPLYAARVEQKPARTEIGRVLDARRFQIAAQSHGRVRFSAGNFNKLDRHRFEMRKNTCRKIDNHNPDHKKTDRKSKSGSQHETQGRSQKNGCKTEGEARYKGQGQSTGKS